MSSEDKPDTCIKFSNNSVTKLSTLTFEQQSLLTWTAIYVFVSLFITFTIIIWAFVILDLIGWQLGVIYTVISYVIFYGLSVLYRYITIKDIEKNQIKMQKLNKMNSKTLDNKE